MYSIFTGYRGKHTEGNAGGTLGDRLCDLSLKSALSRSYFQTFEHILVLIKPKDNVLITQQTVRDIGTY